MARPLRESITAWLLLGLAYIGAFTLGVLIAALVGIGAWGLCGMVAGFAWTAWLLYLTLRRGQDAEKQEHMDQMVEERKQAARDVADG